MCIETNSHQKVPASQAVAQSQPRRKAERAEGAPGKSSTNQASDRTCSPATGSPAVQPNGQGQASAAACSRPARPRAKPSGRDRRP